MRPQAELPKAFADLGIETRFLKALAKMEFVKPSEIQAAMIPAALAGDDIMGQARTGTGKTAAFGLPALQQLKSAGRLQALCLVPTRELAVQVTAELQRIAEFADLHIVAVYGGQKIATQEHLLGKKPHFVVGTPGRVMDFMRRRKLDISQIRFVILDEVDRMLDIGFRDDIKHILGEVKAPHQTILVSATIDDEIKRLAQRFMRDPREINVSRDVITVDEVDQFYVTVDQAQKFKALMHVLEEQTPAVCIVFTNTKHAARKLANKLNERGIDAKEIHGDLIQRKRDRVMHWFRTNRISVLVATDLAARGIDVSTVTHIINYDLPQDAQIYVHRIGRTARMGRRGVAITFVTREEGRELTTIEMLINRQLNELSIPNVAAPKATPKSAPQAQTSPARSQSTGTAVADKPHLIPRKTLGGKHRRNRRKRF